MSIRKAGVIQNYTVIEAVGKTLAELLTLDMENPISITIASPGENYGVPVGNNGEEPGTSRINLFLYRVEEPPYSRNNDWVDEGEGRQIPFPLTLNLHYMLNIFTPNNTSNLAEHLILGDVMRVFHGNTIIDPIYFEGTLNPNEPPVGPPWEELKIMHNPLTLEELSAIWHAINQPYRLSVAYEVSVVTIAAPADKARRVRRVDVTHVKAIPFKGRPIIRNISPDRGYGGDLVTISGERFESAFLKVYLNDLLLEPDTTSMTEITFHVPENLPPGLYSIKVETEGGSSREMFFEELSPFLYRIDPEQEYPLRYPEDPEFPKQNADGPVLTIWGGNFLTEPPTLLELLIKKLGETAETVFTIPSEQTSNNSIRWMIPANLEGGRKTLRVHQGGTRTSNALVFEIPVPQIHHVNTEKITTLPHELVIIGDYYRPGATKLYLQPGPNLQIEALSDTELVPLTFISENEIHSTLSSSMPHETYQLVVRVYEKYYSEPYKIKVGVN